MPHKSIAALFLSLCLAACAAPSQPGPKSYENAAPVQVEALLSKLRQKGLEREFAVQKTYPGITDNVLLTDFTYKKHFSLLGLTHFPSGLGSPQADARAKALATGIYDEFNARKTDLTAMADEILKTDPNLEHSLSSSTQYAILTYAVTRPSPGYLSLSFTDAGYSGGAHGSYQYTAMTFDLKTGAELGLGDFLGKIPPARLVKYLNSSRNKCGGEFRIDDMEGRQCKGGQFATPVTEEDLNMSRIVLIKEGALIIFNPYEKGPFALGAMKAFIPKADFIKLGGGKVFWN